MRSWQEELEISTDIQSLFLFQVCFIFIFILSSFVFEIMNIYGPSWSPAPVLHVVLLQQVSIQLMCIFLTFLSSATTFHIMFGSGEIVRFKREVPSISTNVSVVLDHCGQERTEQKERFSVFIYGYEL